MQTQKTDIWVDPLILAIHDDILNIPKTNQEVIDNFWNAAIDFEDEHLSKNYSPFVVMLGTPMAKIHFLFTMLNINMLLVLKKGVIKGMITKLGFIQKRKEDSYTHKLEEKKARKEKKKKYLKEKAVELAEYCLSSGKRIEIR